MIIEKITENTTLSEVEKEELKSLIKTAVRDDNELSAFVSGLASNNVFVYVDVKDVDPDFKYDATWDSKMFYSRLLMAPFSRIRTNGYMHIYMGEVSPKTYKKNGSKGTIEALPTYTETTLTPEEVYQKREAYIAKLKLFTENEDVFVNIRNSCNSNL